VSRRRLSPGWLAAAIGLFLADLAAHLPITDFFDYLARRYGFFEYDHATAVVFLAAGLITLGAGWWWPSAQRRRVRIGLAVLAVAMAAAKALIIVSAIEHIHYPQYALLVLVFVRAGASLEAAWLSATGLGVLDEAWQHVVLPRGTPAYLDANDIVLNAIGALLGVVAALAWTGRGDETPRIGWRAWAGVAIASALAALVVGPVISSPFYSTTPGGRHFHLLSPFEAAAATGAIWAVVRWLAAAPQPVGSGP
jgi:hypothetical protein